VRSAVALVILILVYSAGVLAIVAIDSWNTVPGPVDPSLVIPIAFRTTGHRALAYRLDFLSVTLYGFK
jgi:hypothetical protein